MPSTRKLNILKSIYVLIVLFNIIAFIFGISQIVIFFRDKSPPKNQEDFQEDSFKEAWAVYNKDQFSCGIYFIFCIFMGLKFLFCTPVCCEYSESWVITVDVILLLVVGLNFAGNENRWITLSIEVLFALEGFLMYLIKKEVSKVEVVTAQP